MFKFVVLIASLAYATAGHAGADHSASYAAPVTVHQTSAPVAAHYSSAPAVSYSSFTRHQNTVPVHHGYAQAAPVLAAPSHAYATAPLAHTYAAPAVSYGHNYAAPAFSHGHNYATPAVSYGHKYAAPAVSYGHNYAAPAVSYGQNYATSALSYGHSYAPSLSHDNYGYSAYAAPLAAKTFAVAQPQLYHQNTYASHAVAAPVLATSGYSYGQAAAGAHLLGYNNHHSHHAY